MKVLAFSWFVVCLAGAQTQPAPAPMPPAELPNLPDSAVIAIFPEDHTQFTMGDLRKYIAAMPPESQGLATADPRTWIEGFAHMRQLAHIAEKEKLAERSPLKEQLELQRLS